MHVHSWYLKRIYDWADSEVPTSTVTTPTVNAPLLGSQLSTPKLCAVRCEPLTLLNGHLWSGWARHTVSHSHTEQIHTQWFFNYVISTHYWLGLSPMFTIYIVHIHVSHSWTVHSVRVCSTNIFTHPHSPDCDTPLTSWLNVTHRCVRR